MASCDFRSGWLRVDQLMVTHAESTDQSKKHQEQLYLPPPLNHLFFLVQDSKKELNVFARVYFSVEKIVGCCSFPSFCH